MITYAFVKSEQVVLQHIRGRESVVFHYLVDSSVYLAGDVEGGKRESFEEQLGNSERGKKVHFLR